MSAGSRRALYPHQSYRSWSRWILCCHPDISGDSSRSCASTWQWSQGLLRNDMKEWWHTRCSSWNKVQIVIDTTEDRDGHGQGVKILLDKGKKTDKHSLLKSEKPPQKWWIEQAMHLTSTQIRCQSSAILTSPLTIWLIDISASSNAV